MRSEIQRASYWAKKEENVKTIKFWNDYGIPGGLNEDLMYKQILLGSFCSLGDFPSPESAATKWEDRT